MRSFLVLLSVLLLVGCASASWRSDQREGFTKNGLIRLTEETRFNQTRDWVDLFRDQMTRRAREGYYDYNRNISMNCAFDTVMDDVVEWFENRGFRTSYSCFSRNTTSLDFDFCDGNFVLPGTFRRFYNVRFSWGDDNVRSW